jgi:hypothetical protein
MLKQINSYNPFSRYAEYDNREVIRQYLDLIRDVENGKTEYVKSMIATKRNAIAEYASKLTGMSRYQLGIRNDQLVVTNELDVNVKWCSYWGLMAFGFWYVKFAVLCVYIPHMVSLVIDGTPVPLTDSTHIYDKLVFNIARQSKLIYGVIV